MATHDTVIQQGRFTSNGNRQLLSVRSDVDFIEVYNLTKLGRVNPDGNPEGVRFYWQRGMGDNFALFDRKQGNSNAIESVSTNIAGTGFRLIDATADRFGSVNNTIQSIDGDGGTNTVPRVLLNDTGDLQDGDVVQLFDIDDRPQYGGILYTINQLVNNTGFDLPYMPTFGADDAGAGSLRPVRFDTYFIPRKRTISQITQANQAEVTVTVDHDFEVGEEVRIQNPDSGVLGMPEIDGVRATVVAVTTAGAQENSITLDVDSNNFAAFQFPTGQNVGAFTPAEVIPIGSGGGNTGDEQHPLVGVTENSGFIGVELQAGEQGPAGADGNVIYWRAGTSFAISNN